VSRSGTRLRPATLSKLVVEFGTHVAERQMLDNVRGMQRQYGTKGLRLKVVDRRWVGRHEGWHNVDADVAGVCLPV
jgi:hypothetical protein